ncbi:hypothetical protein [Mesorhizobium onobrychidis]|uniref:hypothetical protein n=1 Tax=Mesorhizobium onobrychidis TaxID=2775404 RepID=UPI0035A8C3A7
MHGFGGWLIGVADLVPDHVRDDRRPVIGYDDHLDAIAQQEISNLGFGSRDLDGRRFPGHQSLQRGHAQGKCTDTRNHSSIDHWSPSPVAVTMRPLWRCKNRPIRTGCRVGVRAENNPGKSACAALAQLFFGEYRFFLDQHLERPAAGWPDVGRGRKYCANISTFSARLSSIRDAFADDTMQNARQRKNRLDTRQ